MNQLLITVLLACVLTASPVLCEGELLSIINTIESREYVEAVNQRCLATSTKLESGMEPEFVLLRKPADDLHLMATAAADEIMAAGFDPNKYTTIFVHGFTQSYPASPWLRRAKSVIVENDNTEKQNYFIMNWGKASKGSYPQNAGRVSGIGNYLAFFVDRLISLGADRMKIHFVCHSIGVHVCGFAGKRLEPRIGRITALDSAGPCFGVFSLKIPYDRLTPGDAVQVDVYHYDDSIIGLPGKNGDIDVYVNGGSSQPGCGSNAQVFLEAVITMVANRDRVLSPSHTRSGFVATSQLSQTNCQQVAYNCKDYKSFKSGECGSCGNNNEDCFLIGFPYQYKDLEPQPIRKANYGKSYYIIAPESETFCTNHYQILFKLKQNDNLPSDIGRLTIKVDFDLGDRSRTEYLTNKVNDNLYSVLFTDDNQPKKITTATVTVLRLFQLQKDLFSDNKFTLDSVEFNFLSNIEPEVRKSFSSRLCPAESVGQQAFKFVECSN